MNKEIEMNMIYIHLRGGLVQAVDGLPPDYGYFALDWDEETELSAHEAVDYIDFILKYEDTMEDKIYYIREVLDRVAED